MTDDSDGTPRQAVIDYSATAGLARRLAEFGCAIAFTSYQSNLLYLLGAKPDGGLHIHQTRIARPMGLRYRGNGEFLLGAGSQIIRYVNVLGPGEAANDLYDACFVPRQIHVTGNLDAHDVGFGPGGTPYFVATRYNCLAAVDPRDSFAAVWVPPFITEIVDEDRCHLNGLAMDGDRPAFASAVSRSNTVDGWRDRRADGGVIIDIETGSIVCDGLSMPHSPRLYRGELWVLNAGTGEFGRIVKPADGGVGRFEPVCFCPGFLRGLGFVGDYAILGLSKPRYKRFEGLDLERRLKDADSEPWCGIQMIDLRSGRCAEWFRIDGAVAEIYDVEVFPGTGRAMAVGPSAPELATLITHQPVALASFPAGKDRSKTE